MSNQNNDLYIITLVIKEIIYDFSKKHFDFSKQEKFWRLE